MHKKIVYRSDGLPAHVKTFVMGIGFVLAVGHILIAVGQPLPTPDIFTVGLLIAIAGYVLLALGSICWISRRR